MNSANSAGLTATKDRELPSTTDRSLVRRAQAGDRGALVELYRRYVKELYGYAYNQLGSVEDAEDLTSETFLRLVGAIDSYQGRSSFRTWLYVILRNQLRDHWRKNGRRPVSVPLEIEADDGKATFRRNGLSNGDRRTSQGLREVEAAITLPAATQAGDRDDGTSLAETYSVSTRLGRAVLAELPSNYRAVLRHRIMDGRSIRDTAEEMQISEGNVKVMQHRALKRAAVIAADIESREGKVSG